MARRSELPMMRPVIILTKLRRGVTVRMARDKRGRRRRRVPLPDRASPRPSATKTRLRVMARTIPRRGRVRAEFGRVRAFCLMVVAP